MFFSFFQPTLLQAASRPGRLGSTEINSNYTILDQGESESLLREIINENDPQWLKDKSKPKPKLIYSWLSYCRNTQISITDYINEKHSFSACESKIWGGLTKYFPLNSGKSLSHTHVCFRPSTIGFRSQLAPSINSQPIPVWRRLNTFDRVMAPQSCVLFILVAID